MPWQQYVADVALELDPITGMLVYDEVGLTVPRQSGKSTFLLAKAVHRGSATSFFGARQQLIYTAQTRKDARKKFVEDYIGDVQNSATFSNIGVHLGNGDEHLRFPNRSRFGIESTTEKSGHGGTLDEAYIDEAFAQIDNRLEQGFGPAMITRRNTQTWVVSTAGWLDASPFLSSKVALGRESVEAGIDEGAAYFEWSAGEDEDPADPATWRGCMPALGITITEAAIRRRFQSMTGAGDLSGFRRAYLNQWVARDDVKFDPPVDMTRWSTLADHEGSPPSPVVFAVTMSADRKWGTISLAGRRADGGVHVQVVKSAPRGDWIPERMGQLVKDHKPLATMIDPAGPEGSLIGALTGQGVELTTAVQREFAQGCGLLSDGIDAGTVHHSGQAVLTVGLSGAKRKPLGEAFLFVAADSTADISPAKGVALAMFGLSKQPKKRSRSGKVW